MTDQSIRVLFVCTGNSARSQIGQALLERLGGADFAVESAGTEPKGVNPYAVAILAEVGIDWSAAESKPLAPFLEQPFDHVITVCDRARQACPVFPGATYSLHWGLEDPAEVEGSHEEKLEAFRRTREELTQRLRPFVESPADQQASRATASSPGERHLSEVAAGPTRYDACVPGFSVLVTLAAGVLAWLVSRFPSVALAAATGAAIVFMVIGVAIGGDMGVVGTILALVFAIAAGVLLGRFVPLRSGPMLVLLVVASVLDVIWIASGGAGPEGLRSLSNVTIDFGGRPATIGTLDVLLAATIATHWRRRDSGLVLAIIAAPLGMVLANVYVQFSGADNLPLVPFIGVGWLITEAANRRPRIRSDARRAG